jgi:hypothetical protein
LKALDCSLQNHLDFVDRNHDPLDFGDQKAHPVLVKKRRIYWPYGNPEFDAWEFSSPAGRLIVRRNHPLATGKRSCQGWDIWLDQSFLGAVGGRSLSDLATLSRSQLLSLARTACCSRHRNLSPKWAPKEAFGWGGPRSGSGRPCRGERPRVRLGTTVDRQTLDLIDRLRGEASRGEFLDRFIQSHAAR